MARGQRCGLLAVLAGAPLAGATTCATPVDLSAYSVLTGESASTPQRAVFYRAPSFSLYEGSEQTIFIETTGGAAVSAGSMHVRALPTGAGTCCAGATSAGATAGGTVAAFTDNKGAAIGVGVSVTLSTGFYRICISSAAMSLDAECIRPLLFGVIYLGVLFISLLSFNLYFDPRQIFNASLVLDNHKKFIAYADHSVVESWPKRSLDAFGNKLTIDTSG